MICWVPALAGAPAPVGVQAGWSIGAGLQQTCFSRVWPDGSLYCTCNTLPTVKPLVFPPLKIACTSTVAAACAAAPSEKESSPATLKAKLAVAQARRRAGP